MYDMEEVGRLYDSGHSLGYIVRMLGGNRTKLRNELIRHGMYREDRKVEKKLERAMFTNHKQSLCWDCQNAVPGGNRGCEWSVKVRPVKGWKVEITDRLDAYGNRTHDGVTVLSCPKFIRDVPFAKK